MMMNFNRLWLAAVSALSASAFAADADFQRQCLALKGDSSLYRTDITRAEWVGGGDMPSDRMSALTGAAVRKLQMPPHCLLEGSIEPRKGADGKDYATTFQLRLPAEWNRKFLFQGGGGMDGFLAPAVGSIPFRGATALPALMRGYAVVSMDGGHRGRDAAFAADQQARLDLAYAATGKVTAAAKQLIGKLYRSEPQKSYFMGCSNGGREAMMAAQRYPLEFDGVVAGNPGFRLAYAAVGEAWDNQHIMTAAPQNARGEKIFANAFSKADLDAVSQAVLNRCDTKDGLKDGLVNAWESCDFKPEMLQKQLGAHKVKLLNTLFGGAKNSRGEQIYASWPYDAGINSEGWRQWKLGSSQTAQPDARNIVLGADSLAGLFITPYSPNFDTMKFDFDRDTAKVRQMAGIFNADSTNLTTFNRRGGKMLLVQGVSDPVFSTHDLRDWYRQLQADTPNTPDSTRLFMVPGMAHCGTGPALDDFDPLTALENWTDNGIAPDRIIAQGKAFPGKSQPLCAYPKTAVYTGGDENKAESFVCR
ncbi:tannase/feruloyl esterase family alpha/beta hydrolase [Chelonobacter oris]|uniref:tannase/feruloyl esterase family alpha/beta hydrolase n=1 Tax=Chelonobacter oris TaxID=505317 RepID=UPI0024493E61|nr:tannase/feruloyl esterase family alpha/beta hydrolase [Chelonobacter oris]